MDDKLTPSPTTPAPSPAPLRPSTSAPLPFDPADLARSIRVNQATFAKMAGVSRQTVSVWVRSGKIKSTFPDGSLDPQQAAREIIQNTDPARLRARVFKIASEDAQALRRRLSAASSEASTWRDKYEALASFHAGFVAALLESGVDALKIEYAEWLAGGGQDAPDVEATSPDEEPEPPALPLFAAGLEAEAKAL